VQLGAKASSASVYCRYARGVHLSKRRIWTALWGQFSGAVLSSAEFAPINGRMAVIGNQRSRREGSVLYPDCVVGCAAGRGATHSRQALFGEQSGFRDTFSRRRMRIQRSSGEEGNIAEYPVSSSPLQRFSKLFGKH
jgi:hypothetical protein